MIYSPGSQVVLLNDVIGRNGRIAFAIPYTAANLDAWRESYRDHPHVVRKP